MSCAVRPAPAFLAAAFGLLLAFLQTGWFVHDRPADGGPWFLFGKDTVGHDVPVQMWVWEQVLGDGRLPLWMPPLKGGLPTVGAFLWTPLAPTLWLHAVLPFPLAQRLQFALAFWWAGLGGYWLARGLGCRRGAALVALVGCTLSGHLVTLVHAGHLQKVLALAWLPWFAGGMVRGMGGGGVTKGTEGTTGTRARGIAVTGLALGMAFLCGHPQIAYAMGMLLGLWVAWEVVFKGGLGILPKTSHASDSPASTGSSESPPALGGTPKPPSWHSLHPSSFILHPFLTALSIIALGVLIGAAQLLPGSEMSALSNRAGGVPFEQATDTSYPPVETLEFLFPRFLGDSSESGHNRYVGQWGERLVSDYAGALVVLLALIAVASDMARLLRRRCSPLSSILHSSSFSWALAALLFLLIGFGRHTPLYKLLHHLLPGFDSFRSPGTFFCGVALALPVLAAIGFQRVLCWDRAALARRFLIAYALLGLAIAVMTLFARPPGEEFLLPALARTTAVLLALLVAGAIASFLGNNRHRTIGMVLCACGILAFDLLLANRAFLRAADWRGFEEYAAPNALDLALHDESEPRRLFEPGRELSLRPVLVGRDALLAYHPISYAAYEEHLRAVPFDSAGWRDQWGVRYVWQPGDPEAVVPPGAELVERLRQPPGGLLLREPEARAPVRLATGAALDWRWDIRTPNRAMLAAELSAADTLEVAETIAPGWRSRVDGGAWETARAVSLTRRVELPPGAHVVEWEYRPRSWLVGLYATALGIAIAAALLVMARHCGDNPT